MLWPRTLQESLRPSSSIFTPNEEDVPWRLLALVGGAWVALWLAYWTAARPAVFPSPMEVLNAFPTLWSDDGLGQELSTSLIVNWQALALAVVVSLPIGYTYKTVAYTPLSRAVMKLRFVSPACFFLPLLFIAQNGHQVKVLMLALGESFFLVTSVVGIVKSVTNEKLDACRTMRMSEWQVTWYAIVRGTIADVLTAIRDNAAMGWAAVMMVEGFVQSEGGVGVMALKQEKHLNMPASYAIILTIMLVGAAQDWLIGVVRWVFCPWIRRADNNPFAVFIGVYQWFVAL